MVVVSPPTMRLPVTVASSFMVMLSKVPVVEKNLVVVAEVPVAEVKVRAESSAVLPMMDPLENVEPEMEAVVMVLFARVPPSARSPILEDILEVSLSY